LGIVKYIKMDKETFNSQYEIIRQNKPYGMYWGMGNNDSLNLCKWWNDGDAATYLHNLQDLVGGDNFEIQTKIYNGKKYDVYMNEMGRYKYNINPSSDLLDIGFPVYGPFFIKYNSSCDNCGEHISELVCKGCKNRRYCGKKCQKENWEYHKEECK